MKREKAKRGPIDKYTSWFLWRECECCRFEFKREPMFRFLFKAIPVLGRGWWVYLCRGCCDEHGAEVLWQRYIDIHTPKNPPRYA